MFHPPHFLAQYLPLYFTSAQPQSPTPILTTLSLLKNFFTFTLTLYKSIDDSIHLLSFFNTHFCLSPPASSTNLCSPPQPNLLDILLQSESAQKAQITKLSSQLLALLLSAHVECSKTSITGQAEKTYIVKFLTLSQKLRFQLEISKMSMGVCEATYDEIMSNIFEVCRLFKNNCEVKRIVAAVLADENFNVSDSTRTNIISGIKQNLSQQILNSKLSKKNQIQKKAETFLKTKTQNQKPTLNQKLKMLLAQKKSQNHEKQASEAKKRIEEYSKLHKLKQIHKSGAVAGRERTIYHMRKSKFIPREGPSMNRSTISSCELFEYTTQMSTRSIEDLNRSQSQRFASLASCPYESDMDMESEEEVLVGSTPRVERKSETIMQLVSRRLHFSEE